MACTLEHLDAPPLGFRVRSVYRQQRFCRVPLLHIKKKRFTPFQPTFFIRKYSQRISRMKVWKYFQKWKNRSLWWYKLLFTSWDEDSRRFTHCLKQNGVNLCNIFIQQSFCRNNYPKIGVTFIIIISFKLGKFSVRIDFKVP